MESKSSNLFEFEAEYQSDLHFIPMNIRYKLDVTGIKVGLDAWNKIPIPQRFMLLGMPYHSQIELAYFKETISKLTVSYFEKTPEIINCLNPNLWAANNNPQPSLLASCPEDFKKLLLDKWPQLLEKERYAFYKLSISKRREYTFGLACRELLAVQKADPMFANLIKHMHWSNSKVIEWMSVNTNVTDEFTKLMSHILNAEHIWICRALQKDFEFDISKIHTLEQMKELNNLNHEKFISIIQLDPNRIFEYKLLKGTPGKSSVEEILIHVFSHGFHHAGQMSVRASTLGKKFPGVSYIEFTRSKNV